MNRGNYELIKCRYRQMVGQKRKFKSRTISNHPVRNCGFPRFLSENRRINSIRRGIRIPGPGNHCIACFLCHQIFRRRGALRKPFGLFSFYGGDMRCGGCAFRIFAFFASLDCCNYALFFIRLHRNICADDITEKPDPRSEGLRHQEKRQLIKRISLGHIHRILPSSVYKVVVSDTAFYRSNAHFAII